MSLYSGKKMIFLLANFCHMHIIMSPSYGAASGSDFTTELTVINDEHHSDVDTTKLVMHLPYGLVSVQPEVPFGWFVNMTKDVPETITWTASSNEFALQANYVLKVGIKMRLSCEFSDPVQDNHTGSNSLWQGQHTLWFKVEQHHSDNNVTLFTVTLKDKDDGTSPLWSPRTVHFDASELSPYVFFYSGEDCNYGKGMHWMGEYIAPSTNRKQVLSEQRVLDLVTQTAITAEESLEDLHEHEHNTHDDHEIDKLTQRVLSIEDEIQPLFGVAAVALTVSSLVLVIVFVIFCVVRFSKQEPITPPSSASVVVATPLEEEIQDRL